MSAELGQWCLALALSLAVLQSVLCLLGAQRGVTAWMQAGREAARAQAIVLLIAFACLASAWLVALSAGVTLSFLTSASALSFTAS